MYRGTLQSVLSGVEIMLAGIAGILLAGWILWRWYRREQEERRKGIESVERRLTERSKKPPEDPT
jgi:hypothetical protein